MRDLAQHLIALFASCERQLLKHLLGPKAAAFSIALQI